MKTLFKKHPRPLPSLLCLSIVFLGCSKPSPKLPFHARKQTCSALLVKALGDIRVRRADSTTWMPSKAPMRLCLDDRVFAGEDGQAHITFGGTDQSDVWVGAGTIFNVGRTAPLSARLAKVGQGAGKVWVGSPSSLQSGATTGAESQADADASASSVAGLRLDIVVREHSFAFPREAMRVVPNAFPTTLNFQLTEDYMASNKGAHSRGVLWLMGKKPKEVWSHSQEKGHWKVPVQAPGSYVFQVFSETTRNRTRPAFIEVVSSREVALLPAVLNPGAMVVLP